MEGRPKRQFKKTDKKRHHWSIKEEEVLIVILKDMVSKGWKRGNYFRAGYLKLLERTMVKVFPRTDIRAEPHIISKLLDWKKYHGNLSSMLEESDFSWNASTNMIEAQDDVWNLYMKTDSKAWAMRHKAWPLYPDWCKIFGKDKATRENAEDSVDAVQEIETNKRKEKEGAAEPGCIFEGLDDKNEMSVCQPQSSRTKEKQPPRKQKLSDCNSDPFIGAINIFFDKLDARFEDIAERIGYEYDVSKARRQVYAALGRIPGLLVRDKLIVAKFLVNRTADTDLFFSLPDKDRSEMVYMILSGQY